MTDDDARGKSCGDAASARAAAAGMVLFAPPSYALLFNPPAPAGVIVGDSAVESAFALSALAWFLHREGLRFMAFWGPSARFHSEACRSAAPPAARHLALGRRPPGVLAFDRFNVVDIAEDADRLAARIAEPGRRPGDMAGAGPRFGPVAALLDPDNPLERRCRDALLDAFDGGGA